MPHPPPGASVDAMLLPSPRTAIRRVRSVLAAHPWIADGLLWALPTAAVSTASVAANTAALSFSSVPHWAHIAIALVMTIPLALRRLAPLLSSALIALGCVLLLSLTLGPSLSIITVPLTVFSTAAWGSRRDSRLVLALGLAGAVTLGGWGYLAALQSTVGPGGRPVDSTEYLVLLTLTTFCAAIVLSAWLLGILAHRRRTAIEDVHERNRLLEKERESESRLAADAERMRIAREMHDIIAHSLSVVIAQADGGRYAAANDPDAAEAALTTIARTGREALTQTRSLLGVLRSEGSTDRTTAPLPGLDSVPSLVADVRAAGLAVGIDGFDRTGPAERLSDGAGLAVYRIVQEALTNVLKHAGSGARTQVALTETSREIIVRITDDGAPATHGAAEGPAGTGSGLTGMRERAALYGGTVEAGPNRRGTGFTVIARFPATASPQHSAPVSAHPDESPVAPSFPSHADPAPSPAEPIEEGAR